VASIGRVAYDPTDDWRRFRGPVLAMAGADDVLDPAARRRRGWSVRCVERETSTSP
jgi:pimeloyl-ACP methyl ester carboxylesterase